MNIDGHLYAITKELFAIKSKAGKHFYTIKKIVNILQSNEPDETHVALIRNVLKKRGYISNESNRTS